LERGPPLAVRTQTHNTVTTMRQAAAAVAAAAVIPISRSERVVVGLGEPQHRSKRDKNPNGLPGLQKLEQEDALP
jgi:hypothetical protein